MMYHGKLYGKLWDKYFDTSHTTDEWDAMKKQIKELKAENEALKQSNGVSTGDGQSNIPDVSNNEVAVCPKCASKDVIWTVYCNSCNEAM